MTTQYSAPVQAIIDMSMEAARFGEAFTSVLLTQPINQAAKDSLIDIMERNVAIQEDLYAWSKGERSFETWVPMHARSQQGFDYNRIDPTGRLEELANVQTPEEDLRAYYSEVVEKIDFSGMYTTVVLFKEGLDYVKAMEVVA